MIRYEDSIQILVFTVFMVIPNGYSNNADPELNFMSPASVSRVLQDLSAKVVVLMGTEQ
jgi:predicted transcriptional regulator